MLKIKPTVIEKISTLTTFGRIFSISLAPGYFLHFCKFTKSETKKKCISGCLFQWMYILFLIHLTIPYNRKYPVYQFVFHIVQH